MNFQIRIRTDEQFTDILYIKDWLDAATEGFAFQHALIDNNHYHVYLFGLQRNPDAMRRTLGKYLPKQNYSISKTAGKDKKELDQSLAYQYGTTQKLIEPCWTKTTKLDIYQQRAEANYAANAAREARKKQAITEILVLKEEKLKQDRTWQNMITELIENPTMYDGMTVPSIKSKIAVGYLRQLKAVPRPSDLHRYAVSLYYIVKHGLHQHDNVIEDDALINEYKFNQL